MKKNTFSVGQVWVSGTTKLSLEITEIDARGRVHYRWVTNVHGDPANARGVGSQRSTLAFFTDELKVSLRT